MNLTIIGGGPCGLAAAIYTASEGFNVTLIEQGKLGGQASHSASIKNFFGHVDISGAQLAYRAAEAARRQGVRFVKGEVLDVTREKDGTKVLTLAGRSKSLLAGAVLCCTGVQWRTLPQVAGSPFVQYGLNPEDCWQRKGETVAIIGGANSAGQAAVKLAKYAKRVFLISRSPLVKSMSTYLIQEVRKLPNISVLEHTELDTIAPSGELFAGGWNSLGIIDKCFVFIGAEPSTDWLACKKDHAGYILTGTECRKRAKLLPMETSMEGVFAAGDIRSASIKRLGAAVGEAATFAAQLHLYAQDDINLGLGRWAA